MKTLDAAMVARLLPQGEPIRLVDEVTAWSRTPRPTLTARYRVAPEHPVLAGHFVGQPVWPGVYLIEGLAQATLLLGVLAAMGGDGDSDGDAGNFEFKVSAPVDGDGPARGLLAAVDVKLTAMVLPGDVIEYTVSETHVFDALRRYSVDAQVRGRPVARGALTVAMKPLRGGAT